VFDQLRRRVTLSLPIHLLAQPAEQIGELAARKCRTQVAQFLRGAGKELGAEEIAERVGGEVGKHPGAPVTVLQAALGIAGRRHAEVAAIRLVPGSGKVGHG